MSVELAKTESQRWAIVAPCQSSLHIKIEGLEQRGMTAHEPVDYNPKLNMAPMGMMVEDYSYIAISWSTGVRCNKIVGDGEFKDSFAFCVARAKAMTTMDAFVACRSFTNVTIQIPTNG